MQVYQLQYFFSCLLEKGAWRKIKSKGGPFPIRGHRAVRVKMISFLSLK
jgi:hypothetical protein